MPHDPYGPKKASARPDLKAAHKGTCAVCAGQKTVYPTRIFPEDRPRESAELCSDCLGRMQREQVWPLPAKQPPS